MSVCVCVCVCVCLRVCVYEKVKTMKAFTEIFFEDVFLIFTQAQK